MPTITRVISQSKRPMQAFAKAPAEKQTEQVAPQSDKPSKILFPANVKSVGDGFIDVYIASSKRTNRVRQDIVEQALQIAPQRYQDARGAITMRTVIRLYIESTIPPQANWYNLVDRYVVSILSIMGKMKSAEYKMREDLLAELGEEKKREVQQRLGF